MKKVVISVVATLLVLVCLAQTGVRYRFKAEGDYFYLYADGEWKQQFMRGVNIGATEPGLFPGDLTISYDTYYRWFGYISAMNCNCIRICTLMPPQFYQALGDFNRKAQNPLYLYQGIWVNEEDIERLADSYAENEKILNDFTADAVNLVNVIHGNARIAETAGEAYGTYTANVSSTPITSTRTKRTMTAGTCIPRRRRPLRRFCAGWGMR